MTGKQVYAHGQREAGFTLVELAVVMIIIGLLIGGILKGQELIANAAITGTASSIKGIDAATTTFRDTYAAMPGDMAAPNQRLPSCTAAPCSTAGNGNSRVDGAAITAAPAGENIGFWAHLSAADLISGVNPVAGGNSWGANFPSAPITGGFHAAFFGGGNLGDTAVARTGHYLVLNNTPGLAPGGTALTPLQAARIDRKLDDGNPTTGTVFPGGAAGGASTCDTGSLYDEDGAGITCDLYIRFQN